MRNSFWTAFLALCVLICASGCANYQLGTEAKLDFKSVYVAPVENAANIPQATALFGTQIRDALLRDGRVTLATSPESADAVLTVDLRNYSRRVATVRRNDTGLARSFDIELQALCTLKDTRSGKIYFADRPVTATREVFTSDGNVERNANGEPIFVSRQLQAEYQTLPILASTLADRIAHAVLDVW
jgi:hypothetical protein